MIRSNNFAHPREDERRAGLRPLVVLCLSVVLLSSGSVWAQNSPKTSSIPPLLAKLVTLPVQAQGAQPKGTLQANINFDDISLDKLFEQLEVKPPVPIGGRLTIKSKLTLPLETAGDSKTYQLVGTAQAPELKIGDLVLRAVKTNLRMDKGILHLEQLTATTPNSTEPGATSGIVEGSVAVGIESRGPIQADLKIRGLDIGALTRRWTDFPVKLEGIVTGVVKGKMTYPPKGDPVFEGRAEVTSPKVSVQGVAAQAVKGHVQYQGGKGDFEIDGQTLGGTFQIDGKIPAAPAAPDQASRSNGTIRLRGVRLESLASSLWQDRRGRLLHGSVDADFDYELVGSDFEPRGQGRVSLSNVRWRDEQMMNRFQARLALTPTELRIYDFQGDLTGGTLRGLVRLQLKDLDRSEFAVSLSQSNVEGLYHVAEDLFESEHAPLTARSDHSLRAHPVGGKVNVNLRGTLGRRLQGSGAIVLSRGQVGGLGVSEWRLPVQFTHSFVSHSGHAYLLDGVARFSQGQASGSTHIDWADTVRFDTKYRFNNVELRALTGGSSTFSSWTAGRLTGRLELSSQNLRSADDLDGSLKASLKQSQAFQVPVLGELTRFVAPGKSSALFQTGDVEARLRRGVVHLKRLTLSSSFLALLVEGRIHLTGRLDLKATARTGNAATNQPLLETLAATVPAAGPIPLPVAIRITRLLANRVVYLRITGTVNRPNVRLQPLKILTEEAIRFLIFGSSLGLGGSPLSG